MGVLYFADDLNPPSVLWMRRMLSGLEKDVAALVTESDPGSSYSSRYRTVILDAARPQGFGRVLRGLGLGETAARSSEAVRAFSEALESEFVSCALVHYATNAVAYRKVWKNVHKPIFVHCHGWDVTWELREGPPPGRRVHDRNYQLRVQQLPDHVHFIANSRRTIERLGEIGVSGARVHLKYLGVPVPPMPPKRRKTSEEVNILYLGRLVDFKGPELVIEAFELACRRGLKGRLRLAGDGPLRDACEAVQCRSEFRDSIEILGSVDAEDGIRLRAEADIFTAHNRLGPTSGQEEAFGVSVVEAMAAGLPVVSGDSGSLREVVESDVQGILVAPGDVSGHANALLGLAEAPDRRFEMGQQGWKRALDHFSIEREMSRLREILGFAEERTDVPGSSSLPSTQRR